MARISWKNMGRMKLFTLTALYAVVKKISQTAWECCGNVLRLLSIFVLTYLLTYLLTYSVEHSPS
jgi:hypothetical protein